MSGDKENLLPRTNLHCYPEDIDQMTANASLAQLDIDTSSISFPKSNARPPNPQYDPVSDERGRRNDDDFLLSDDNYSTVSDTENFMEVSEQLARLDPSSVLQAVVFLEDAFWYRSVYHKVHPQQLRVYRKYQSTAYYLFRISVIFILHMLAFFEYPSSLTISSDLRQEGERIQAPCWTIQSIEAMCLLCLLLDNIMRVYWMGTYYFVRHKWDLLAMVILGVSLVDWTVSSAIGCDDFIRFRRFLRPFFIMQHSSIMKKIVNCLFHSFPEIVSILLMLAMHLLIFTLFGMLLFPDDHKGGRNSTIHRNISNATVPSKAIVTGGDMYFKSFLDSFISLLVLLTTANNPDVTMKAYSKNRFASLFFVLYLLIGLYCFMNMLLAVIYNQFRGYFQTSMQSSLIRRRLGVRASFEVLRRKSPSRVMEPINTVGHVATGVGGQIIHMVVERSFLPRHIKNDLYTTLDGRDTKLFSAREYQYLFLNLDNEIVCKQKPAMRWCENLVWRKLQKAITHRFFVYFGIFIVFINLFVIAIQMSFKYDSSFRDDYEFLLIVNFVFILYYTLEQCLKLWAFGFKQYISNPGNVFDAVITSALIITEICSISIYGLPELHWKHKAVKRQSVMWNVVRIINILIMVRMWKIVPHIKAMSLVASVLMDLMRNMKAFAGVLVVLFYFFAILGIELFHGKIQYKPEYANMTFECGTYEQLNYWANNFDDFFAAIIVLWDIMVVNNWHVFLAVFREKTNPWSYLYFIAWWLMSVIVVLNLFTALIMENFIMKWDRRRERQRSSTTEDITFSFRLSNVYSMFKDLLHEPADNELVQSISNHQYMALDY